MSTFANSIANTGVCGEIPAMTRRLCCSFDDLIIISPSRSPARFASKSEARYFHNSVCRPGSVAVCTPLIFLRFRVDLVTQQNELT